MQHAMDTVLEGRTALVMDGGRIVEDGPPDELIAAQGEFAQLHRAWRDSVG